MNVKMIFKILCLIALCTIMWPAIAQTPVSVTIRHVQIDFLEPTPYQNQTRDLIPFRDGDIATTQDIDTAFASLKAQEWIGQLDYTVTPVANQIVDLNVSVRELPVVRGIRVSGNYPFLAKKIRRLIPLQPGTVFRENLIEPSKTAIVDFLQKNGFYDSEVTITHKPHKKYPAVDLKIKIHKGPSYHLRHIAVTGNEVISSGRIRNKIKRGSRFREKRLKQNLRKIDAMYNKKGYVRARVRADTPQFETDTRSVDLTVAVKENKRLALKFSGKKAYSATTLKTESGILESQSYDAFAVDEGRERLKRFYSKNGYANAEIESTTRKDDKTVFVEYHIDSGKRIQLQKIKFSGNKKISKKKLSKLLSSKQAKLLSSGVFDPDTLQRDRLALMNYYRQEGFLDAEISEPHYELNSIGNQTSAEFQILEGDQYEISDVEFYGLPDDSFLFAIKLPLRDKKIFNEKRFLQTKEKILEELYNLGYAYATIASEIQREDDASKRALRLIYTIDAGQKTRVRSIMIRGNYKTKRSVLNRNLGLRQGDLFNYQKLLNAQLRLRKLGVFSTVKATALGFDQKKDMVDLVFEVTEEKSITVNAQVGYDNRSSIRGELNFTKRNLFGIAKQWHSRFIGGLYFNRIETTFVAPRIFGADLNLTNQYFAEYENTNVYDATAYGTYVSVLKNFGERWTLGIKDQITHNNVIESKSDVDALGDALFDNTLNEFRVFGYYDSRDNFADPGRGVYIYANNKISTEITDASNNFDTIEFGISQHKRFLTKFTWNNSLRYGHIFGLTRNALVPFNELFFMGGSDTVRGFDEDTADPSGGLIRAIYNGELDYNLRDAFKIAVFFDAGVLGKNFDQINSGEIRESAGVGLRYFTPVGPIRLDYGRILDRRDGEPSGRVHFSFGYFF